MERTRKRRSGAGKDGGRAVRVKGAGLRGTVLRTLRQNKGRGHGYNRSAWAANRSFAGTH